MGNEQMILQVFLALVLKANDVMDLDVAEVHLLMALHCVQF